ncbi:transcriptional regulator [Zhouia spongiae]|uniref:Transcriptional regulator n=1 Tax=Zhouia spongiae TaxID=2202721 RepID=A0ABY3YIL1_9FLAO|nr:transcriptional regulator [Zhouia spongiae]UNY97669.1 transcriptional regulator [Zhouia spongiae]
MTSVITGDIVNSRQSKDPKLWLHLLKKALTLSAREDRYWEVFRGDSFQIEIQDYHTSFMVAVYLKSVIRSIKGLDVRLAIGIGNKDEEAKTISEATGEAFIFSGERFERLKKDKTNLAIKTINSQIDEELNLYFKLLLLTMDTWTANSAEIVKTTLEHPTRSQQELGELIGIKQNTVSERQKRANLDEVMDVDRMFRKKINQLQYP